MSCLTHDTATINDDFWFQTSLPVNLYHQSETLGQEEVHPARSVVPKKSQSLSGEKSQMPDSQEPNCIQSTVNETLWQHTVFTESSRTVQRCSMISCDRAFCCILQCMFTHAQYYEHVRQWVCVVLWWFFLNNVFLLKPVQIKLQYASIIWTKIQKEPSKILALYCVCIYRIGSSYKQ